ncbi:MAG: hypothetical protein ACOYMA_09480 [Bacteroidia bacterium]
MIEQIKKWLSKLIVNRVHGVGELTKERTINNFSESEIVTLEGKEYYKVKIKFVDTMSFELAKHVDLIEAQHEELMKQVVLLDKENKKLLNLNTNLNSINKNLFNEVRILKSDKNDSNKLMYELQKKENEVFTLKCDIKYLNKLLDDHQIKAIEFRKQKAIKKELNIIKNVPQFDLPEEIEIKDFEKLLNEHQKNANTMKRQKGVIKEIGYKLLEEIALQKTALYGKKRQMAKEKLENNTKNETF